MYRRLILGEWQFLRRRNNFNHKNVDHGYKSCSKIFRINQHRMISYNTVKFKFSDKNIISNSFWNWVSSLPALVASIALVFVLVMITEFKTPEDCLSQAQYGAMMINSLYWQFLATKIIPLPPNLVLSSLFLSLTTLFQFVRSMNHYFMTERTEHGHSLRLKRKLEKFEELSKIYKDEKLNWFETKKSPKEPDRKSES